MTKKLLLRTNNVKMTNEIKLTVLLAASLEGFELTNVLAVVFGRGLKNQQQQQQSD